jgi:3-deoxy-D-manno-octulosonate 8-phosphate phosphatase (KDO 8-P phosphatase)
MQHSVMMDYRTIHERCRGIDLVVMDVDGVLTDGRIIYTERGEEVKAFHVRDGSGIKRWLQLGKQAALLTGRASPIVERRGQELGITAIIQGAQDKLPAFERLLAELGIAAERAAYIGDDWPDVPVLRRCGLAVAVADACDETMAAAHYVTHAAGGQGAVRELIDLLLRHQHALTAVA